MAKPQQSKGDNYICYIYHHDFVSARLQIEISMISETFADVQHLETAVWKLPYMSRQNTRNSQNETYFYTHWKYTINVFNLPFNLWLVSPFIVFCLIMITAIPVSVAKPTRTTMNHHDQPGNRIKISAVAATVKWAGCCNPCETHWIKWILFQLWHSYLWF